MTPAALGCVALLASGCAGGAVLELTLYLPQVDEGVVCETCPAQHAVVDARAGGESFDEPGERVSFVLSDAEPRTLSVVATEDYEASLEVRVRFCEEGRCTPGGPEARARFERAFYPGHHTFHTLFFNFFPGDIPFTVDVARCALRGCTAAEAGDYCTADGRHLCE